MERANQILHDLELDSLRARHHALGPRAKMVGSSGHFYFYSDAYAFAGTPDQRAELKVEADALNRLPSILERRQALATDGIFPKLVCYSEPGNEHLILFVEYDKRGRRELTRSLVAPSRLRTGRRVFSVALLALAGLVLPFAMFERASKQGWLTAVVGVGILLAVVFVARNLRRMIT